MGAISKISSQHPAIAVVSTGEGSITLRTTGVSLKGDKGEKGEKGDRGVSGASGVGTTGATGATGATGPSGSTLSSIELVSSETITAYTAVTSDGYEADSSDLSTLGRIVGIATTGVAIGNTFEAIGSGGEITNASWTWTRGDLIYLNGTHGTLSTIAPSSGYSQSIGTAVAADTIAVEIGVPILL